MKFTEIWRKYMFLCGVVFAATACTNELDESATNIAGLKAGDVAVQLLPANMGVYHTDTRGTDPKTAKEQEINNIHVFVFKADGTYLEPQGSDAFQGYDYKEGNSTMVFNRTMFEKSNGAKDATVFVLANMPKNTFTVDETTGKPKEITNINDFKNFVFNLPQFTVNLPEEGLPMVGSKKVDFSPEGDGSTTVRVETLQLKSLMARLDFNFSMDPMQESGSNQYPSLVFNRIGVYNFPSGGAAVPQLGGMIAGDESVNSTSETDTREGKIELLDIDNVTGLDDFTGHYIREKESQSFSLYMFEHARLAETYNYPDDTMDETEKQRYKNKLAKEDAAYIEMEGIYTNHNDYMYKVTYTLYPGGNPINDFTIKSNCQYKNNIVVKGITVNNEETEALLDTRVNIDTKANPYFIEMLRERQHDAHFNVTPMDVFIYEGGSVKVEIADENGDTNNPPEWIRMEPKSVVINKSNSDLYNIYDSSTPRAIQSGDGKRKYFTTSLLDELDGQDNSKSYEIISPSVKSAYEERIYFYIDENVPNSSQASNGTDVPLRKAILRVTYTRPKGESGTQTYTRDIPIWQAGMRAVQLTDASGDKLYWYYVEEYEEYLNYFDGKDKFEQTYDGLEWGFEGIITGLNKTDGNEFMPYGWRNTMTIMKKFRDQTSPPEREMTLNDKPRGATEYCYNKNKRNPETHRVDKCNWYHPSIREIEHAMDKYYGTYKEFQSNWYWGSNPGPYGAYEDKLGNYTGEIDPDNITWTGEHPDYARATMSILQSDGRTYEHATSEANKPYAKNPDGTWDTPYDPQYCEREWGLYYEKSYPAIGDGNGEWTEGKGGYAKRDKIFRIRAVYIPDSQIHGEPSTDNTKFY